MSYEHGILIEENPTSLLAPLTADSATQVIIGTAPIHLSEAPYDVTNQPVIAYSFAEAKKKLGYSDDFKNYTLCESMDCSFRVFNVSPLILINVLDAEKHKESKTNIAVTLTKGQAVLEEEGILLPTLTVQNGIETYEQDIDYTAAFNDDGLVVINRLAEGDIPDDDGELTVSYDVLNPSLVEEKDILQGIEAVAQIFPRLGVIPGLLLAPKWSHKVNVGMALLAKANKLNGNFNLSVVLDADSEKVTAYDEVGQWKNNNYVDKRGIVCWPQVKVGEKQYHMSTFAAARIAQTDAENSNVPFVSPSNKMLKITATVLADGTEIFLDQVQANLLNGQGIVTAINNSGWRLWGNNTSIYPASTDVKDRFIPVRRMFDWQGNTFLNTYFQKIDDPMNRRLIESIVDSENIRLNGLKAKYQIADARIEYLPELNPLTDLLDGKITFKQYFTPFPPAETIVDILEYDPEALAASLAG